jgi:hypothetical protein
MSKEVVEWLRDYARRCEQYSIADTGYRTSHAASKKFEADLARQFADEIEQRFVLRSVAELASRPSSFPPTRVYAATGKFRRRRT